MEALRKGVDGAKCLSLRYSSDHKALEAIRQRKEQIDAPPQPDDGKVAAFNRGDPHE